jgi:hypothetical protein
MGIWGDRWCPPATSDCGRDEDAPAQLGRTPLSSCAGAAPPNEPLSHHRRCVRGSTSRGGRPRAAGRLVRGAASVAGAPPAGRRRTAQRDSSGRAERFGRARPRGRGSGGGPGPAPRPGRRGAEPGRSVVAGRAGRAGRARRRNRGFSHSEPVEPCDRVRGQRPAPLGWTSNEEHRRCSLGRSPAETDPDGQRR